MALTPRTYEEVYAIIRSKIQERFPDADFNEGSFNDIFAGAYALAYQELQTEITDLFGKTWFSFTATTGNDLERLAVDHFHVGARRPSASRSIGVLTLTRKSGVTAETTAIVKDSVFRGMSQSNEEIEFLALEDVTILSGSDSAVVQVRARIAGLVGNLRASSDWSSDFDEAFDVTNSHRFQGGAEVPNDSDYRIFIRNFISSVQDGTPQGLEGTARLVSGISDARLIRNLIDVGTLQGNGSLESNPFRFKAIRPILYVTAVDGTVNDAIISLVRTNVLRQLSAGETIEIVSATPVEIDLDVTLTFTSSVNALRLSQNRDSLEEGFRRAIEILPIGADFDRSAFISSVLDINGWDGFFTIEVNAPSGDVTIAQNEKAVLGTINITVT